MAESEYKILKTRIEELIKNIEDIDKEAASFSAAKSHLVEVASNLNDISIDLKQAIKTSEAVLNQVNSVAVTSTLKSMETSADKYAESTEIYLNKSKEAYIEHEQEIQNKIDKLTIDFKKKMLIMCGIAIGISIVALICAFI